MFFHKLNSFADYFFRKLQLTFFTISFVDMTYNLDSSHVWLIKKKKVKYSVLLLCTWNNLNKHGPIPYQKS